MKKFTKRTIEVPLRILDIGGWTDTEFAQYGQVLNFCTYLKPCSIDVPFSGIKIYLNTENICEQFGNVSFEGREEKIENIVLGNFDRSNLIFACLKHAGENIVKYKNFKISIESPIPSGASLGASAAIAVGIIKCLIPKISKAQAAQMAWEVETKVMGGISGTQDQFAASYAKRCNLITVDQYPNTKHKIIKINPQIIKKIEDGLITVYLGKHSSYKTHEMVLEVFSKSKNKTIKKLRLLPQKALACLQNSDLMGFGKVLIENTELQRELHPKIVSKKAQKIIDLAERYGALGWKINGAGGNGGTISFIFKTKDELYNFQLTLKNVFGLNVFLHRFYNAFRNNFTGRVAAKIRIFGSMIVFLFNKKGELVFGSKINGIPIWNSIRIIPGKMKDRSNSQ